MSVASSIKISSCSSFMVFISPFKFPINSFYNSVNVHSIFDFVNKTVSFFFCIKKQFFKTGYIPTICTSIINYNFGFHFYFPLLSGLIQAHSRFLSAHQEYLQLQGQSRRPSSNPDARLHHHQTKVLLRFPSSAVLQFYASAFHKLRI